MTTPVPPDDPQPPSSGYSVPPDFGRYGPSSLDGPYDPLVPPPAGGLSVAWMRFNAVLRACSGRLMLIMLLTVAVPQVVMWWLINSMVDGATVAGNLVVPSDEAFTAVAGGVIVVALLLTLASLLFSALGWGAGIWTITQVASGREWSFGAAFAASARRLGPMFGWYLLYGVMVAVGLLLCVLPGLYLAAAGSMFSFVLVYQRGRAAMAESFRLVHRVFWPVVGRFLLVAGFMAAATFVVNCCTGFVTGDAEGTSPVALSVSSLADVPIYTIALVGLLLTYTQARARHEPVTTDQLWREANQHGESPPGFPAADQSR